MGKHHHISGISRFTTRVRVAGVSGVAVAASLLSATPSSAASVATWNAVAQCESSGNWANHDSGHNGHYGGLQFSPSSWAAAGGLKYAPRADYATKDQQIAVAERLLAMQGPGAWECASAGGLTVGGPTTNVHPNRPTISRPASATQVSPTMPVKDRTRQVKHGHHTHTVRPGDTLSGIARANHLAGGWHELYGLNRGVIKNADLIFPGQHLRLA
ncbi:transglycosylase family protein [Kitasatospora sp. NPDC059571]|uniref:transglycosylase family protein n=1 Tax=Kitasatospora sp. NPDC059571 TaxID=3346871 RepID=UPI0036B6601A